MTAIAIDLPSKVEETLAACPQFRIVVIGKSGVGKSSLVSNIFSVAVDDIHISHDRAGKANIEYGHTSDKNMRFILHDSLGFEPGTVENWKIVESFLRERSAASELQERVHAIWLCIEAPRTGSRLQETSDEKLLRLADELNIPAIAVFTKYDMLVNEYYQEALKSKVPDTDIDRISEEYAEISFNSRIKDFQSLTLVPCVKVSTDDDYPEAERLKTLRELVDITRQQLLGVEGDLYVLWATAQQVSAHQKVQRSISEGCKKYWMDLGRSTVFQGHNLIDCVQRIHNDILKIWNFNDPLKLLSGDIFFAKMLQLVEPLLSEYESPTGPDDRLSQYSDLMSLATAVGTSFAQILGAAGIGIVAFKYLYGKYRRIPLTAQYLGAYIVDLTLVLHHLFINTLVMEPPRPLSEELISGAVASHKDMDAKKVHNRVHAMTSGNLPSHFETKIADLIREFLQIDTE
ncbi:hypothetical protein GALMADRAFT_116266 [Galerina marginata CBS 339.88]|uniref:G domain-containing protein n=1 Tax=Galerina marginata (strain CBS 339.88) TaxID=685588 RepID=A0A067TDE4_GALM3|nr:hypothetical protein GALMADRAFT_116266 [Galerina marginata CBS 339.88]